MTATLAAGRWLIIALVVIGGATGCTAATVDAEPTSAPPGIPAPSTLAPGGETAVGPLDAAALERVARTRIFFAHRSVGSDIVLEGVPEAYRESDVPSIVISDGLPLAGGSLGNVWLAQTEDPRDKIADFERWVTQKGAGAGSDIAFMKLGFVDIVAATDVGAVFENYRSTMDRLERTYPHVTFLHATVSPTQWDPQNNAAIERYNALLRENYSSTGRLFDLSAVLSRCSFGDDIQHTDDGQPFRALCPEYSRDGGHLNDTGNVVAAREMLRLLARFTPAS